MNRRCLPEMLTGNLARFSSAVKLQVSFVSWTCLRGYVSKDCDSAPIHIHGCNIKASWSEPDCRRSNHLPRTEHHNRFHLRAIDLTFTAASQNSTAHPSPSYTLATVSMRIEFLFSRPKHLHHLLYNAHSLFNP